MQDHGSVEAEELREESECMHGQLVDLVGHSEDWFKNMFNHSWTSIAVGLELSQKSLIIVDKRCRFFASLDPGR